jgi:hypothetical protein
MKSFNSWISSVDISSPLIIIDINILIFFVELSKSKTSKDLKPWVYDFVLQEFPTYREWYWGFCKKLGQKAGIPELSPMSFRHTFGCNLDELCLAPSEIQALMNCSLPVLIRYPKRQERETDKKLEEKGW